MLVAIKMVLLLVYAIMLVDFVTTGLVIVTVLKKKNAIQDWSKIHGCK